MRKLLLNHSNGGTFPRMVASLMVSENSSSFHDISRILISETPPTAPSPFPFQEHINQSNPHFIFPHIPFSDTAYDFSTICVIFSFIALSLLCMSFIFHLYLKSKRKQHLQHFNSFWIVRLMLITFAIAWTLNEVLRLPILRRKYLYPSLPFLTLAQEENLCKFHVVLSFGFLQPGFLITLLFLINISIQKKNINCLWAFVLILAMCCPVFLLQAFFVFHSPMEKYVPKFMHISSISFTDLHGHKMVFCSYPMFSCIIFVGFAMAYSLVLLISSWRVVEFVINKSIRARINVLSFTVLISLTVQILCLGILSLCIPQDPTYSLVTLVMFLDVAFCMAAGQIILVLKPIVDALAAGGEYRRWSREIILGRPQMINAAECGKESI